jgi:P-type conjugative transfer protein TrbG
MKQWVYIFFLFLPVLAQTGSTQTAPPRSSQQLTPTQKKELSTYDFDGALKKIQNTPPNAAAPEKVSGAGQTPKHSVPPIQAQPAASSAPGAVSPIPSGWQPPKAELNATALTAATVASSWESSYNMPTPGADGRVVYAYGAGMPVVVCAPLRVCAIELEPGEHVQSQPQIGDARRWEVTPVASGSGLDQTALLIVKPIEAGLDTDLVVPTDRRTYVLRLVSDPLRYISRVAFRYPADDHAKWASFQAREDAAKREAELAAAQEKERQDKQKEKDQKDGIVPLAQNAMDRLYFDYKLDGEPTLRPERVLDDGQHTYIVYPNDGRFRELPTLMISTTGSKVPELVNFRVDGNKYIVDRLFDKGVLIVGVGKKQQRKVTITRLHSYAAVAGDKHVER